MLNECESRAAGKMPAATAAKMAALLFK